jgi:hypothetical protein
MKKLLIGLLALGSITANAAFLTCSSNEAGTARYNVGGENRHVLLEEGLTGRCNVHNPINLQIEDVLEFTIEGYGPGFRINAFGGFTLTCPTALRKNLLRKPFIGVKASAAAILGADVGVFANSRGGTCILTGLSAGAIGAGVSGAKLTFH